MNPRPDFYAILGISRDATPEEIRRAYVEAARRLHPDKNVAPGETELFLEIQQAYETLSDPKRRKAYDATLPPAESTSSILTPEVIFSRPQLVRLNEPQLIYVLLTLRPSPEQLSLPLPALNVCLVLDRSTSMKGVKIDLLKAATIQFLRSARPEDIVSVVAFSDRAEVIIPASYYRDRLRLETLVRNIQPSGATEIFQGLQTGLAEVQRAYNNQRINHIILLTDGYTYGDEQACLNLAEEAMRNGIGISAFGLGTEWNDIFLDQLAGRTGNTSAYIAHPKDIQKFLLEKFKELTNILCDEVVLMGELSQGVQVNYAFRLQPQPGPIPFHHTTALGTVIRSEGLSVLFEFLIHPSALNSSPLTLWSGRIRISMASQPIPPPPIPLRLERLVEEDASPEPPPPAIVQALSRLMLYRLYEQARQDIQAGHHERATRLLKSLAEHLIRQDQHQLAHTVLLEAEHLQRKRTFSLTGEKEIKYGTRALLLPPPGSKQT